MDKPFKTIEQQMAILRSRNMDVDSSASAVLKREGYYSVVNSYKAGYIKSLIRADMERRDEV